MFWEIKDTFVSSHILAIYKFYFKGYFVLNGSPTLDMLVVGIFRTLILFEIQILSQNRTALHTPGGERDVDG